MKPEYFDIHAHVNFNIFEKDRNDVVQRALNNNVWFINVGTQVDTSRKAVKIANQYKDGVYAIVGLHPIHTSASYHDEKELGKEGEEFTSRGEIFDKNIYREFLKDPKVLGIGECGLDYYRLSIETVEKQKISFIEQIELANEFNKPLMLHIRNNKDNKNQNAYFDALEILKKYSKVKGNVHFFAGGIEEVKAFLDFDFSFSFNGVITFTNDYDEVIKYIPMENIMTETDCPYLTPIPYRGQRNEPSMVKEVIKKISLIKNLSESEVSKTTINNVKRVWKI